MSLVDYLLEQTAVYRLWQAPLGATTLVPLSTHNNTGSARRVPGASLWNMVYCKGKAKR